MNKSKKINVKESKEDKNKKDKAQKAKELAKNKEKEKQYKKLEEYMDESGLSLAFNIIFAELISKQILPENFFTYTSMRLIQIGKEIEGLKTKDSIYVEVEVKKDENEQQPNEAQNKEKEDEVFLTQPNKQNNKCIS